MNFQQLEYIVAVDDERHFVRAAERCFVTQATLSMMIKKLEEELGMVIFDRSKQPIIPTEIGEKIIAQARVVLMEHKKLAEIVKENQNTIAGEIKVGIIPTVAPYLLPLFLHGFLIKYPQVKVSIREITTQEIVEQLQKGTIDMGILATPLMIEGIQEKVLYHEKFKVFISGLGPQMKKKYILPEEIDANKLLLLEEGHCMRTQIINICELQKNKISTQNLDYEAGSIESLINLVEKYNGITIIPELCMLHFGQEKLSQVRSFKQPEPTREISIVTYRHFAKKRILEVLAQEITKNVSKVLELDL